MDRHGGDGDTAPRAESRAGPLALREDASPARASRRARGHRRGRAARLHARQPGAPRTADDGHGLRGLAVDRAGRGRAGPPPHRVRVAADHRGCRRIHRSRRREGLDGTGRPHPDAVVGIPRSRARGRWSHDLARRAGPAPAARDPRQLFEPIQSRAVPEYGGAERLSAALCVARDARDVGRGAGRFRARGVPRVRRAARLTNARRGGRARGGQGIRPTTARDREFGVSRSRRLGRDEGREHDARVAAWRYLRGAGVGAVRAPQP